MVDCRILASEISSRDELARLLIPFSGLEFLQVRHRSSREIVLLTVLLALMALYIATCPDANLRLEGSP